MRSFSNQFSVCHFDRKSFAWKMLALLWKELENWCKKYHEIFTKPLHTYFQIYFIFNLALCWTWIIEISQELFLAIILPKYLLNSLHLFRAFLDIFLLLNILCEQRNNSKHTKKLGETGNFFFFLQPELCSSVMFVLNVVLVCSFRCSYEDSWSSLSTCIYYLYVFLAIKAHINLNLVIYVQVLPTSKKSRASKL